MKRPALSLKRKTRSRVKQPRRGLAEELRAWRKRNGFSQSLAAQKLKVSPRTLQNWEQEHREPRGFALEQLREKLRRTSQNPKS
jgi:DNA-binding transcriptional regulator YiaG